jgi:hypothetical protein
VRISAIARLTQNQIDHDYVAENNTESRLHRQSRIGGMRPLRRLYSREAAVEPLMVIGLNHLTAL